MQITEQTAQELLHTMKNVEKLLKAQQKENKPVWIKAQDLPKFTIWKGGADYEKAREMGWVQVKINNGGTDYDLSTIPDQFRIFPQKATT